MLYCLVSCNWNTVLIGEVNLGGIHLANWSSVLPWRSLIKLFQMLVCPDTDTTAVYYFAGSTREVYGSPRIILTMDWSV